MKILASLLLVLVLTACNLQNERAQKMQVTIDSLQKQLDKTYKPGLGEFMSGIQIHHAKLWFAGQYQNWPLADFEVHEIMEELEDIQNYCGDRPEIKAMGMIQSPIDSVNIAIQQKNTVSFKSSFVLLTNTCNICHQATGHTFNVITIPANPPVFNQDFHPSH